MKALIYQVDAFTSNIFAGNPAAVVLFEEWPEDSILQLIAAENNLSETAFLVRSADGFTLRWFTPAIEVDLCGHATLASAHVLFEHLEYPGDTILFHTVHHGTLTAHRSGGRIVLVFPSTPPTRMDCPDALREALGVAPTEVYRSRDLLALFNTQEEVAALKPDFQRLKSLPYLGVIATAPGKEVDFVSRFFAPNAGIDEDPVTGSAHTTLIPFWSARLDKQQMEARQISARTGQLHCTAGDTTVRIAGEARTFLTGEISW
jgi:PhzF family phenazine biosynthesis protein